MDGELRSEMRAENTTAAANPRAGTGTISSGLRTTLTLLLIFHLFALGIGVLSTARPLSPLRNKLADVPLIRPYLRLLHMDVAYNFHLTDGTADDVDHFVVIEPQQSGEEAEPIVLPPVGLAPGIRRERFQQLAFFAAPEQDGDPAVKTLLPKAIAAALLRQTDAPDGTYRFRIRRQMLVAREQAQSSQRSFSDPYAETRYDTAYEGAVIVTGSQLDFLEIAPEGQRAGLRAGESSIPGP